MGKLSAIDQLVDRPDGRARAARRPSAARTAAAGQDRHHRGCA